MKTILIFATILITLSNTTYAQTEKHISAVKLSESIRSKTDVLLLDIRSLESYMAGHLSKSINIPFDQNFGLKIKFFEEKYIIVLVSSDQNTSEMAYSIIQQNLKNKVFILKNGLEDWKNNKNPIEIFDQDDKTKLSFESYFSSVKNSDRIMMFFGASWCGPCQALTKELDKIAAGETNFKIKKINIDAEKPLTLSQGVEGYPTIIFYKSGVEVWRRKGFMPKDSVIQIMNNL